MNRTPRRSRRRTSAATRRWSSRLNPPVWYLTGVEGLSPEAAWVRRIEVHKVAGLRTIVAELEAFARELRAGEAAVGAPDRVGYVEALVRHVAVGDVEDPLAVDTVDPVKPGLTGAAPVGREEKCPLAATTSIPALLIRSPGRISPHQRPTLRRSPDIQGPPLTTTTDNGSIQASGALPPAFRMGQGEGCVQPPQAWRVLRAGGPGSPRWGG